MIYVIATIEIAPGKRDDFLAQFHKIVEPTRAEAGCIEYGPTIDLETNISAQPDPRDNVVVVVEKWETLDHLEAHLVAPHMIEYRAKVKEMVQKASLQVLQPA